MTHISFLPDVTVDELLRSLEGESSLHLSLSPERLARIRSELKLPSLEACAEHLAKLPKATLLTCFGRRDGVDSQTFIPATRVYEVLSRGFTVVVENAQTLSPAIAEMAQEFRDIIGYAPLPGGVALSISPPGDAVPLHFDGIETLSFQLDGSKIWSIGRAVEVKHPDTSMFLAERHSGSRDLSIPAPDYVPRQLPSCTELQRFELNPGDGLALGRGWWHTTAVPEGGAHSYGLIFKMPAPSAARYLMQTLGEQLSADSRFRRPLIGMWSTVPSIRQAAQRAWAADRQDMLGAVQPAPEHSRGNLESASWSPATF